jgi:hypothetical protein
VSRPPHSEPKAALWEQYRAQIDALSGAEPNFDLERRHEYSRANGWHIDDYDGELPAEPPGPPVAGGSWEVACTMVREYRFPDPSLITGIFYPDRPLDQRVMLLRAQFLGLTFFFGVRVGGVLDTTRDGPRGPERAWGYNYQTLKGHFERGQIDFTVIKELATGRVHFQIHAFSQIAKIANPFFWLGFRMFGRWLQRRFARRSLERMQLLVQEQLAMPGAGVTPAAAESAPVQPASAEPGAAEALEQAEKPRS